MLNPPLSVIPLQTLSFLRVLLFLGLGAGCSALPVL